MHLAEHKCFGYAYLSTPGVWHYTNASGEQASVRPAGQLRVNNGEAVMPALLAGFGIADLPDFIVGDAIASGEVEVILKGWTQPEGAVHLVTPPGGPRPARVEVLADFLAKRLAKGKKRKRLRRAGNRRRSSPCSTISMDVSPYVGDIPDLSMLRSHRDFHISDGHDLRPPAHAAAERSLRALH